MMGAQDLILHLREIGFSIGLNNSRLQIAPADKLTDELKQTIRESKVEIFTELEREARRSKVIAMLAAEPEIKRAIYADTDSDPYHVILAVAVRSCQQMCEMQIPKTKYDPWKLLELIERHGAPNLHKQCM